MIEYLTSKGWKHTGNCGTCNGGFFYTNPAHEGWRLKINGNIQGLIQKNQNGPGQPADFKNLDMFSNLDYEQKLNQFFQ